MQQNERVMLEQLIIHLKDIVVFGHHTVGNEPRSYHFQLFLLFL